MSKYLQEAGELGAAGDNLEHGRGGARGRRLLQRGQDERHLCQGVRGGTIKNLFYF